MTAKKQVYLALLTTIIVVVTLLIFRQRQLKNFKETTMASRYEAEGEEEQKERVEDEEFRDVIHVAFVGVGEKFLDGVRVMVESMLLHHGQGAPIRFHLVGDALNYRHLNSSLLSHRRHSAALHDWERYKRLVDYLPNEHYAGVYALLKLLVPDIVAGRARRVIVLDTDLVFNADVAELWALFDRFRTPQALALAEEQSVWYRDHEWPAAAGGSGLNSGVMLMDVQKLQRIGWSALWRSELLQPLMRIGKIQLGDQDVINVVQAAHPQLFYRLSCAWNRQWIRARTPCAIDQENTAPIKILHWNRKEKTINTVDLPEEVANTLKRIEPLIE